MTIDVGSPTVTNIPRWYEMSIVGGGYARVVLGGIWKPVYFLLNFAVKLKLLYR